MKTSLFSMSSAGTIVAENLDRLSVPWALYRGQRSRASK